MKLTFYYVDPIVGSGFYRRKGFISYIHTLLQLQFYVRTAICSEYAFRTLHRRITLSAIKRFYFLIRWISKVKVILERCNEMGSVIQMRQKQWVCRRRSPRISLKLVKVQFPFSGHQPLSRRIHGLWPHSPEVGQHDIFKTISPNVWTRTTGPIAEKEIYKSRHRS